MTHLQLAGLGPIFIPNDATEADLGRAIRRAELLRDLRQVRAAAIALNAEADKYWRRVAELEAELGREGRAPQ